MISCSFSTSPLAVSRSVRIASRSTRNCSTALFCVSNIDVNAASRAWSRAGFGSGSPAWKSMRQLYLPLSSRHRMVPSTRQYWRNHWPWPHPRPVQSFQQQPELRGAQANHPILHRRPHKAPVLQALVEQAQTRAVPGQDLDPISPLAAKHKQIAGERVLAQRLLDQGRQAVQPIAEIDRPRRHHDAYPGRYRDHVSSRTICSTRRRSPLSNPVPRRIVSPAVTTSIRLLLPITAGPVSTGDASLTGTNSGAPPPTSAARLRS